MAMFFQQEKQDILYCYAEVKEILELYKIITKFLTTWTNNIQRNKDQLDKKHNYLTIFQAKVLPLSLEISQTTTI